MLLVIYLEIGIEDDFHKLLMLLRNRWKLKLSIFIHGHIKIFNKVSTLLIVIYFDKLATTKMLIKMELVTFYLDMLS